MDQVKPTVDDFFAFYNRDRIGHPIPIIPGQTQVNFDSLKELDNQEQDTEMEDDDEEEMEDDEEESDCEEHEDEEMEDDEEDAGAERIEMTRLRLMYKNFSSGGYPKEYLLKYVKKFIFDIEPGKVDYEAKPGLKPAQKLLVILLQAAMNGHIGLNGNFLLAFIENLNFD